MIKFTASPMYQETRGKDHRPGTNALLIEIILYEEDIRIISFLDENGFECIQTIKIDSYEIGEVYVEHILRLIKNKHPKNYDTLEVIC